jgi:hypothetical protein
MAAHSAPIPVDKLDFKLSMPVRPYRQRSAYRLTITLALVCVPGSMTPVC